MLMSPIEIIKTTWRVYTENFKLFIRVTAWGVLPALALSLIALIHKLVGVAFYNYSVMLYLALSALSAIIVIWIQIVIIRLINSGLTHQTINLKETKSLAWHDVVSYFWVSFLTSLAIAVGLIALVVPGLIFTVWFAFATTIFAIYHLKGRAALIKSKSLVAGRFWSVALRLAIPYLLYVIVIGVGIGIVETIFGAPSGFKELQTYSGPWWSALAEAIPSLILLPIGPTILVTLIHDLETNPLESKTTTPTA